MLYFYRARCCISIYGVVVLYRDAVVVLYREVVVVLYRAGVVVLYRAGVVFLRRAGVVVLSLYLYALGTDCVLISLWRIRSGCESETC